MSFNFRNLISPVRIDVRHKGPEDLIFTCYNIVTLNGFNFGFSEVSGLDRDIPYSDEREGGNSYPVYTRKYSYNFEQITLRRGLAIKKGSIVSNLVKSALSQAAILNTNAVRKAAILKAASLDPIITLEQGPAIGYIQIYDRGFKELRAAFSFFSYGASRWDVTDVSSSGEIMYETVTLVCKDLQRLPVTSDQSGIVWDSFNQKQNQYYEMPPEEIPEHGEHNSLFLENRDKNSSLIEDMRKNDESFQTDRMERVKKFEEWQENTKKQRKEEAEKLEKEQQEIEKSKKREKAK